jgi:hypothetical protein
LLTLVSSRLPNVDLHVVDRFLKAIVDGPHTRQESAGPRLAGA